MDKVKEIISRYRELGSDKIHITDVLEIIKHLKEYKEKKLRLHSVSQQRELLNFRDFIVKCGYGSDEIRSISKEIINDYIKFKI